MRVKARKTPPGSSSATTLLGLCRVWREIHGLINTDINTHTRLNYRCSLKLIKPNISDQYYFNILAQSRAACQLKIMEPICNLLL